jgi:hypothetical protein
MFLTLSVNMYLKYLLWHLQGLKTFFVFQNFSVLSLVSQNIVFMLANSFIAVKRFATLSLRELLIQMACLCSLTKLKEEVIQTKGC